MKTLNSFIFILCLLSIFFVEVKAQSWPKTITNISTSTWVVIPVNQSYGFGTFSVTYGPNVGNGSYESVLGAEVYNSIYTYPNVVIEWTHTGGGRPTSGTFWVNSIGQHTFYADLAWWDMQWNYSDPVYTTFNVMKEWSEVGIVGPSYLGFKKHAIYTVNITDGSGLFTYQWYSMTPQTGSDWFALPGGTANTQNFTMVNYDIPIRVDVQDNVTGASLSAYYTIHYDSDPFEKRATTQAAKPSVYTLSNNPNPFNPSTVINYQLPEISNVKLSVYDILGKEVTILVNGMKEAGYYTATFNASRLPSGIYFARFTAIPQDGSKPVSRTMKMLLAK